MGKLDITALKNLSDRIAQLPARTVVTPYEIVKGLAPAIQEALRRGQDLDSISKLLVASGVRLAPSTIGNYLRRASKEGPAPISATEPAGVRPADDSTSASPTHPPVESPLERARRAAVTSGLQAGRFELAEDKDV